jgi:hypothetical protein
MSAAATSRPVPRMPRLPRKMIARARGYAHPAIVRADHFQGLWEALTEVADEDTLELMAKVTERFE